MQKLVIFDLDGTVIDTIEDICDAMNKMLIKYGFKTITTHQMKKAVGGSSRDIVRLAIGEKISDELLDECEAYYTQTYVDGGSPKTKPFEGMMEVILALKERGYKITALSNKPQLEIDPIYDRVLKPLGFDRVVGLSEKVVPKPNPSGAKFLMQEYNASPETTYLVGDGETDVMTAKNANVNCVAVLWGNRDKEYLSRYGAEFFANQPFELLNLIK